MDMLFICNPNNPTGQLVSKEFLIKVLNKSSDTKVVIDESFLDFIEDKSRYSLIDMCKDYLLLSSIKSKNDSSITTLVSEDLFNTLIKNSLDTNCPVGLFGLQMKKMCIRDSPLSCL